MVITLLNVDVSRTLTFFIVSKPYSSYAKRNFLANARYNNNNNNKKILLQAIPTSKMMIAHDGSEMSDKALSYAMYLSKASGAELVIMNIIEAEVIPPSFVLAFMKPGLSLEKAKDELRNTMEGAVKQMLEERVRVSKEAGVAKVCHPIRIGKPVEEIIAASEEGNYDLIVMASGKITSPVRTLGSIARRVLDSTRKPILIVHE